VTREITREQERIAIINAALKVLHDKKHSKKSKIKRGEALTMKSVEECKRCGGTGFIVVEEYLYTTDKCPDCNKGEEK